MSEMEKQAMTGGYSDPPNWLSEQQEKALAEMLLAGCGLIIGLCLIGSIIIYLLLKFFKVI